MGAQQHQAKTGAKAGQWVLCPAKQKCRNGGMHVDIDDLHRARYMYKDKTGIKISRLGDIPKNVVEEFLNSSQEVQKTVKDAVDAEAFAAIQKNAKANNKNYKAPKPVAPSAQIPPLADRLKVYKDGANALKANQPVNGELPYADAIEVAKVLSSVFKSPLSESPVVYGEIMSDEEFKRNGDAIAKIGSLTKDQRIVLAHAVNDLAAARYVNRWNDAGKTEFSGVGFNQTMTALAVTTWNSNLTTLLARKANSKTLSNHFSLLENLYSKRVAGYKEKENQLKAETTPKQTPAVKTAEQKPVENKKTGFFSRASDFFSSFRSKEI